MRDGKLRSWLIIAIWKLKQLCFWSHWDRPVNYNEDQRDGSERVGGCQCRSEVRLDEGSGCGIWVWWVGWGRVGGESIRGSCGCSRKACRKSRLDDRKGDQNISSYWPAFIDRRFNLRTSSCFFWRKIQVVCWWLMDSRCNINYKQCVRSSCWRLIIHWLLIVKLVYRIPQINSSVSHCNVSIFLLSMRLFIMSKLQDRFCTCHGVLTWASSDLWRITQYACKWSHADRRFDLAIRPLGCKYIPPFRILKMAFAAAYCTWQLISAITRCIKMNGLWRLAWKFSLVERGGRIVIGSSYLNDDNCLRTKHNKPSRGFRWEGSAFVNLTMRFSDPFWAGITILIWSSNIPDARFGHTACLKVFTIHSGLVDRLNVSWTLNNDPEPVQINSKMCALDALHTYASWLSICAWGLLVAWTKEQEA
jgi:hypothetical protein